MTAARRTAASSSRFSPKASQRQERIRSDGSALSHPAEIDQRRAQARSFHPARRLQCADSGRTSIRRARRPAFRRPPVGPAPSTALASGVGSVGPADSGRGPNRGNRSRRRGAMRRPPVQDDLRLIQRHATNVLRGWKLISMTQVDLIRLRLEERPRPPAVRTAGRPAGVRFRCDLDAVKRRDHVDPVDRRLCDSHAVGHMEPGALRLDARLPDVDRFLDGPSIERELHGARGNRPAYQCRPTAAATSRFIPGIVAERRTAGAPAARRS